MAQLMKLLPDYNGLKVLDLKKLSMAYELASRLPEGYSAAHHWCVDEANYFRIHYGIDFEDFESLDDLIVKMKELAKPKFVTKMRPRYQVDEEVWVLDSNEPNSFKIDYIHSPNYVAIFYSDGKREWHQDLVYPSRESLVYAQIKYLQSFVPDDISYYHCRHCHEDIALEDMECPICGIDGKCHHEEDVKDEDIEKMLYDESKKFLRDWKTGELYR